ncbi:MAG: acetolactate synthase [Rikenellaceae bacterium]
MTQSVEQLSIFLENKIGSLNEIMDILSRADIRIIAATVADTTDYGILRVITDDTQRAYELLKASNKSCNKCEVIALSCDSSAGAFYDQLKRLTSAGVVVEYMYCFSVGTNAYLIMRVDDSAKAAEAIERNGLVTLANADLVNL